ncbi:ABC transporter ATP-binding protein [Spongiactinospora sp. TRM90649]|uniref:ABC transporter ATP-binding protein n=1 Tax=Spongiactinospora sp. TRM90649 TaxID=3031114 RepID=UPI0023F7B2C1|nr:ABC transporter ATP-binding protein [Spongiactinospora sp. TRM90649]MDF5755964.1 ABC transporter ATP-binding protein [Spongiactinospora sp. TRM90649]
MTEANGQPLTRAEDAHDKSAAAVTDRSAHVEAAKDAVLRCDELFAGYVPGVNILNGCDLYVGQGELIGIIGPNGAGKSTLLKAMFGLVEVRTGTVTLKGENITRLKAHALVARGVGYVPQTNNVFPSLTIEENLEMGAFQAPKKFKERFEFVAELFPALKERRKQRAGSLSGGERQMVAMARALMTEPSVLLLDEPSAGLSPKLQDQVFIRAQQINRAGVTVIMVEQNARRCLQICDRGYVLDQGRNAYTATGRQLINDPKVIELYLGTLARA